MKRLLSLSVFALAAACQTYDFEPVQPIAITQTTQARKVVARNLKPNLMILVDKSGSMNTTIDPMCMGPSCATRVTELKAAMGQFLSTSATIARMGLAFFPSDDFCRPTNAIDVQLPAPSQTDADTMPLLMNAQQVSSRIQAMNNGVVVAGGTPTGGSLRFLSDYAGLRDEADNREDLVLLLTDGLPNCNASNPLRCSAMPPPPLNLCTQNPVPNPAMFNNCMGQTCITGYLDRDGVVAAVNQLRARSIRTIVVGFGANFASPEALDVLNAMAEAGGFARACPLGADAGVCQQKFYAAANATELSQALASISSQIGTGNPCVFSLEETPASEKFLAVIIDGASVNPSPTTWRYDLGRVELLGNLCQRVSSATPANPVNVEFRIVTTL